MEILSELDSRNGLSQRPDGPFSYGRRDSNRTENVARNLRGTVESDARSSAFMMNPYAVLTKYDRKSIAAYLAYMAPRVTEMHRLLKPTGVPFL